jgi:hypothetical protein
MFIAFAHIAGAVVGVFAFGIVVVLIAAWEQERNRKAALDEASVSLGIAVDALDSPEHSARVLRFASERFSSELLRNRLSDLCGLISTAWAWLGNAAQVLVLVSVIWYSFSDAKIAVNAWWVVAIAAFFWLISVMFALICKLFTGRFPGQARQARKQLAQVIAAQGTSTIGDEDA